MTSVVTILTERYADWECALAMAACRAYYGFATSIATPDGRPVTSAGGVHVTPDMSVAGIDPETVDAVLVSGGNAWESDDAPDISAALQAVHARGKLVGGICAGTLALARAGLLNDVAHTSNEPGLPAKAPAYTGGARYVETPAAVRDGTVITAAGTAPITFMKSVMEALGKGGAELDFYAGVYAGEHEAA